MTGAGLDYLNVLSEDQLSQYLTNDGKTLGLAHLFRSDMIGRAIPGAMSWRVEVLLSAASPLQTFSPNTVREFLASMHCAVYQGYVGSG